MFLSEIKINFFTIQFDIDWDAINLSTQTIFPVYIENKEMVAKRGIPINNKPYFLSATKGINFNPCFVIKIYRKGMLYQEEENVKVKLVFNENQLIGRKRGSCKCKENYVLKESKPQNLISNDSGEQFVNVRGILKLQKIQLGCLSNAHGGLFSIKIEFVNQKSPLYGVSLYSVPIQVRAKHILPPYFVFEGEDEKVTRLLDKLHLNVTFFFFSFNINFSKKKLLEIH